MARSLLFLLWCCLWLAPSCTSTYPAGFAADATTEQEASLDSVTNGLVDTDLPLTSYLFRDDVDGKKGGPRDDSEPAKQERMLIHRGRVRIEVATPDETARAFLAKVEEWGGHLAQQSTNRYVVRVPAQHFEAGYAWLRAAGRVLDEEREANDVTEEFVDLGIRIDTARRARDRLLEVLQKAEKVEDILKVEAELRRLTEELERMEGRQKFLADQVAMATLSAEFASKAEPPPARRQPRRSRYAWIHTAGPESLLGGN